MRDYKDIMSVATVNFRPFWGRKDRNLSRIIEYIEQAAKRGANLICFPELALTGYENEPDVPLKDKMQVRLAEVIPGASTQAVAAATKANNIYAVFGMTECEKSDPLSVYNVAVACGPGGYIGKYRKVHPANDENEWSKKGDEPFYFDTPWGPVGVGICYDTYSFQELMRYYGAVGARLYLNPTAMAGGLNPTFDWKGCYWDTLKSGVVANDMYIVSSNLVGQDIIDEECYNRIGNDTVSDPKTFAGASLVIGPGFNEKVHLYAGGVDKNEIDFFLATIDLSNASRMIFNPNPYNGTPDFRPDIYIKMCEKLLEDPYWKRFAK